MASVDERLEAAVGDRARALARSDDAGERQALRPTKLVGSECRMQRDVAEEVEPLVDVLAQELGGDGGEVVAGVAADAAAEKLDLARQLLGAAAGRTLANEIRGQLGETFRAVGCALRR